MSWKPDYSDVRVIEDRKRFVYDGGGGISESASRPMDGGDSTVRRVKYVDERFRCKKCGAKEIIVEGAKNPPCPKCENKKPMEKVRAEYILVVPATWGEKQIKELTKDVDADGIEMLLRRY